MENLKDKEYLNKLLSVDRKFIESDPRYAGKISTEYFCYLLDGGFINDGEILEFNTNNGKRIFKLVEQNNK